MKNIRRATVFFAVMATLYLLIVQFVYIEPALWQGIVEIVAFILVGLGILTASGDDRKLTWPFIKQKLGSPVVWGGFVTLIIFIVQWFSPESVGIVEQVTNTIMLVMFGIAEFNNTNAKNSYRLPAK